MNMTIMIVIRRRRIAIAIDAHRHHATTMIVAEDVHARTTGTIIDNSTSIYLSLSFQKKNPPLSFQ
ncbi:unnamed protein product [Gongylonema pulchrum]|uniref:Uncharacterized protein n=1 Tax=Gongylonema pulchrum TaxID=637853 RepID=A0A183DIU9_9BILA|nr:unnamed protein product [Gongylonema pulchrum]